ncbi:hypothetical protein C0992_008719 [Termitomyces sp. T32_za158]|nr:hypothetical protein C0992_008719 [Termitomyces sp. T32_za158]
MSCKFTTAQQNYAVHKLETLAILEALLKWEDKLMGYKIHIITDHKALEFFKTQFDITYVKGELNKVADCLLQYFESDTRDDVHEVHDFVQVDKHIDPDGEDLPLHRFQEIAEHHVEIRAMQAHVLRCSKWLKEQLEVQDLEAQGLAGAEPAVIRPMEEPLSSDDNPTVEQALGSADPSSKTADLEDTQLRERIWRGYLQDKFYVEILNKPTEHP